MNDRPSVRELMQRIELGVLSSSGDHDSFCSPAEVEVEFTDGEIAIRRVEFMRGHPENPMTLDDAAQKLKASGSALLSPRRLRALAKLISDTHQLPRIRTLTAAAQSG